MQQIKREGSIKREGGLYKELKIPAIPPKLPRSGITNLLSSKPSKSERNEDHAGN